MKLEIMNEIICPECQSDFSVKVKKKQKKEILEGQLICTKKHSFPIISGIPRLVLDRQKDFIKTEDAFSSKWRHFNKSYHNKKWADGQRKWFLERFD